MAKLIAIADDLTGAADCVSACAARGMSAAVVLHNGGHLDLKPHWPSADVISIDANTRGCSAERAAKATAELTSMALVHAPEAILFKKVDSTLRGNLAAELAATLSVYRAQVRGVSAVTPRAMILAPALPAQGRTTVAGRQMVHGRPLEETDLWKSETSRPQSEICKVLAEGKLSSVVVDIVAARSDTNILTQTLADHAHRVDIVICDAETDDDLRRIALAATEGGFRLWAGSAGLAAQFPDAIGVPKRDADICWQTFAAGPALIVVGSAASVVQEQALLLAAQSDIVLVQVSCSATDIQNKSAKIAAILDSGRDVLVMVDDGVVYEAEMSGALAGLLRSCADLLGGLVATGGETARALLDALKIDRLRLIGEVESGLPFSIAEGWKRPFPVITKAGAFGSPDALIRCREFLHTLKRLT